MPATRTRQPRPPSYARFERKLEDGLKAIRTEFIEQIEAVRKENEARFELLNLNGSAAALRELGKATPPLKALAERADTLLLIADAAPSLLSAEMTDIRGNAIEHRLLIQRFMTLLPGLLQQMDSRLEEQAGKAWVKRWVREHMAPWKPIGAVAWTVFLVLLGGAAAGYFYWFFIPRH